MMQSADQATQQLQQRFKQANAAIRSDLEKPITIQAEFNLNGDPRRTYEDIVRSQQGVLREQSQINKKAQAQEKLQNMVKRAVNGTAQEKKKALALVERLMGRTKTTKDEMKVLARYAKDLKKNLPKDSDLPSSGGMDGLTSKLTLAGTAANLASRAVEKLAQGFVSMINTGIQMQSLNLQMEAFTGGADQAAAAMEEFKRIASQTPLDVMQVAEAGKIMMAYGVDTVQAVDATERLAIVSAATGGDVNLLARNLGQVAAQGRAYTRDLTQFAIQGIPIWEQMSVVTGKSVAELKDMAREGQIGMTTVMSALRNMTKEGSAFAEVASRMQETYAGQLALLQSEFQATSGQIIESISGIDQALGGVTSAAIEGMVDVMNALATSTDNWRTALEAVQYYLQTEMPWALGLLSDGMGVIREEAGTIMANLVPGIGPAMQQAQALVDNFAENTSSEFRGVSAQAEQLGMSAGQVIQKLEQLEQTGGPENVKDDFIEAAAASEDLEETLNDQIKKLMELAGVSDEKIKDMIQGFKDERDAAQDSLQDIENYYDKMAANAVEAYEEVERQVNATIESSNKVIAGLQQQIKTTKELGPAGTKLAQIKERELRYTARTGKELKGHITEEARKKLEARATLEQMEGQKKAAELQQKIMVEQQKIAEAKKKLVEAEKEQLEQAKEIDEARVQAIAEQNGAVEDLNGTIERLVQVLGGDLANNWDTVEGLIGDAGTSTGELETQQDLYNGSITDTIKQYDLVLGRLASMRTAILNMPPLPAPAGGTTTTTSGLRFAGGPVSGGSTYTVNELGQEAFLSASGKLSMINAPAWGDWKAPGAGTVIPAHLTKQLDIPTGGINVNKAVGGRAGAISGAVRTIAASQDVFNNNVTIQAANPVQAANNMMVEMARLKRRRR